MDFSEFQDSQGYNPVSKKKKLLHFLFAGVSSVKFIFMVKKKNLISLLSNNRGNGLF